MHFNYLIFVKSVYLKERVHLKLIDDLNNELHFFHEIIKFNDRFINFFE